MIQQMMMVMLMAIVMQTALILLRLSLVVVSVVAAAAAAGVVVAAPVPTVHIAAAVAALLGRSRGHWISGHKHGVLLTFSVGPTLGPGISTVFEGRIIPGRLARVAPVYFLRLPADSLCFPNRGVSGASRPGWVVWGPGASPRKLGCYRTFASYRV